MNADITPAAPTGDSVADHLSPLLSPHECALPQVQTLLAWWQGLPRRHRFPTWSAVSKPDLKPWMGWLCLYDVIDGGADFRYRLVGSNLADQAGMDLTGRRLSEAAYGLSPAVVLENVRRIHANAAPTWQSPPVQTNRGYSIARDRIWLPFATDGDTIDLWLVYVAGGEILVDRYQRDRG